MPGEVWTVSDHLAGKPQVVCDLYERFIALVRACGPFEYSVSKSAVTVKGARRGFAGAKPKSAWLDGYLDLQRQVSDPRIRSSSPYTQRLFVHQFRVVHPDDLDDVFAGWIGEAYRVGAGDHLGDR